MSVSATFSTAELALLRAVLDRIVPRDDDPSATGFGADAYVVAQLGGDAASKRDPIRSGLKTLPVGFATLPAEEQDAILRGHAASPWFVALVALTSEGVYGDPGNGGNRDAASWRMVGYSHGIPEGPNGPPRAKRPVVAPPARSMTDYDVVVVGAGAGGGVAACVLAEAGKHVLLIERGPMRSYATDGHRDHLRNHWLPLYSHNAGPDDIDGNPRVAVDADGRERIVRPIEREYQNLASGVGSGTFVYGGQAWRFHPDDFRMASRYGVPAASSLVDWPIGYDELAPWYERAEWEIGVAGRAGTDPNEGPRARDYPMPAFPAYEPARLLGDGAARVGIRTFSPPLLMNSVPRGGRAACIECGTCVGFPCPVDAKNGTHNTAIPRALATGKCDLLMDTMVGRVTTDQSGKVTGVEMIAADGTRATIAAKAVVVAAGAIESARLLLMSPSPKEPTGLGNNRDLVGRNLQGHYYPSIYGLFADDVQYFRGPGVTIATTDYTHGNPGVIGGALLADDFVITPVGFWHLGWPPDVPPWGREAKTFMRDNFRRTILVKGPVHEIPNPDCRVTLASGVRDRFDMPVARLSGVAHIETVRTARFIQDKARAWVEASGAVKTWGKPQEQRLSAHSHQAGTCRMGTDPASSVTDACGRVWGHENLFVSDGSLHPTNGSYNPVLTILALAFRNAKQWTADF